MGGDAGLWVRRHSRELETRERVVMFTAALSCMDSTGLVPYSMMRLADECGLSLRSTQAAVRTLSRLEFLVQADTGFRLARYVEQALGGGKLCRENPKEKESTKEKEKSTVLIQGIHRDSGDSQGFSLSEKPSEPVKLPARSQACERVDSEMLQRIWAGIARELRSHHRGTYLKYLSLKSVDFRELVFLYTSYLSEPSIDELSRYLHQAADLSGHLRERTVRLVCEPLVVAEIR